MCRKSNMLPKSILLFSLIAIAGAAITVAGGIVLGMSVAEPLETPIFENPVSADEIVAADDNVSYDISTAEEGYITVKLTQRGYACQIRTRGEEFNYVDLPEGQSALPISMGDGSYEILIAKRLHRDEFSVVKDIGAINIRIKDDALLRPSYVVKYNAGSSFVAKAESLADPDSRRNTAEGICDWIHSNIGYDDEKSDWVEKNNEFAKNVPDPDKTYLQGKGVCVDQAALATAMLRSVGVPARLTFGHLGNKYHAWALAKVSGSRWLVVDPTIGFVGKSREYKAERYY